MILYLNIFTDYIYTYIHMNSKPISNTKPSIKYIDLFCGIGGFHQAFNKLENFNTECVFACDKDKHCRAIYTKNYTIPVDPDIKKIKPETIPALQQYDILCAGFPCQPFSNAGKKSTFKHHKGLLFDEIMRLVEHHKPKFMFLENVKHILKVGKTKEEQKQNPKKRGPVIDYVLKRLDDNGYRVQIFQMSPHEYGIPQQRERVYFVCVHKSIHKGKPVALTIPKTDVIHLENFVQQKKDIDPKYFATGDVLTALNAWEEMIKIFEVDEKISPTIMVTEFNKPYTDEEFSNLKAWRQDYITKNKPLYQKYKPQWDAWCKKHEKILKRREIYAKLEWQVGKIKENDSIFDYFIQLRQSGIRVKKSKYFPTLVAMTQTPIYGKEKRHITPRECARLQSFPDSFIMHEDDKQCYKQFGNSVNVENVYNVILSTLQEYAHVFV